ncbi:hypothetical protein JW935_01390 [candidate division KSB1 bacterium]|nr:hypothetical protein [candidate division KSB1 bacterium]
MISGYNLTELKQKAQSGTVMDVDDIMRTLNTTTDFLMQKKIDFSLGLICSPEGRGRIRHYLFRGTEIQRNYAALYFKRLGLLEILDEAVQRGCIDKVQAFAS